MITLILVRHGQSVGNVLQVFCGQKDYPLTSLGERQARMTADYLKEHYQIERIYSSDLSRAMQTAEPTAKAFGVEIIPTKELREIASGAFEGLGREQIEEQVPELLFAWSAGGAIAPAGAETHPQLKKRIDAFFEQLLQNESGKCVAIFAHWGGIYKILRFLTEHDPSLVLDLENVRLHNASITAFRLFDDGRVESILDFDYVEHLGDMSSKTPKGLL